MASGGVHRQIDFTRFEDVKAKRGVSLSEKHAVFTAGDGRCLFFQGLDQCRVGDKCRRVEVHERPPSMESVNENGAIAAREIFMVRRI